MVGSFVVGTVALAAFVVWELRSAHPMLDIRLFRHRGFASVNVTAMLFSFGMFGSIFFLTQFLQTVQGLSPLAAGIRVLPWTAMPMLLAPVVGVLAERWGGKPLVVTGLALQAIGLAWLASLVTPATPYARHGGSVRDLRHGHDALLRPSGLTGALGRFPLLWRGLPRGPTAPSVSWGASSASLCSAPSSVPTVATARDRTTSTGMTPAVYVGAVVVAVGAFAALFIPGRRAGRRSTSGPADGRRPARWSCPFRAVGASPQAVAAAVSPPAPSLPTLPPAPCLLPALPLPPVPVAPKPVVRRLRIGLEAGRARR